MFYVYLTTRLLKNKSYLTLASQLDKENNRDITKHTQIEMVISLGLLLPFYLAYFSRKSA